MSENNDIEVKKASDSNDELDETRLIQTEEKRKDQHSILQQDEMMKSSNIFTLIMFFLKGLMNPEEEFTPEKVDEFAFSVGIDPEFLNSAVALFQNGEKNAFQTAKTIFTSIDRDKVDLDRAVRSVSNHSGLNDLPPSGNANFKSAVEVVFKLEGGWNPNEPDGGHAKFGINSNANPDIDVRNLTQSDAASLYKERYWDKVNGIDNMDARAALVVFDLAVNSGPGRANQFMRELVSEGKADLATGRVDVDAFMEKRENFLDGLVQNNPSKYAKYANGWDTRLERLTSAAKTMPSEGYETYQPSAIVASYQAATGPGLFVARPLDTTMTSDFGPRSLGMHKGIDLRTKSEDPNGHVPLHARNDMVITNISENPGGYGNRVSAAIGKDDQGRVITVQFSHLKELPTHITVGSTVKSGEYIATTGSTGRGTGAHLDFEVRIGAQVVDPVKAFETDLSNSANGNKLIAEARDLLGSKAHSGTYASRIAPALERSSVMAAVDNLDSNRTSLAMAQFNKGGVAENDPSQPNPLMNAFDGFGVNEIKTAFVGPLNIPTPDNKPLFGIGVDS